MRFRKYYPIIFQKDISCILLDVLSHKSLVRDAFNKYLTDQIKMEKIASFLNEVCGQQQWGYFGYL